MQEVVGGDPPGVVEIRVVNDILHHAAGVLLKNKAIVCQRSPRKHAKWQVGQDRTPQKSGFGEFELRAEFLLDSGVDDQMCGKSVQEIFITLALAIILEEQLRRRSGSAGKP